jgi:DNA-binding MarR family transcriptional regulator
VAKPEASIKRGAPRAAPARALESVNGATSGAVVEEGALALDRLIHERMRLGIVSALAVNDSLTFNDLKRLMHTTDGNLSVHARKLEDAGYVASDKSFEGRMPRTTFRLTAAGRRALEKYLAHMEAIISALKS